MEDEDLFSLLPDEIMLNVLCYLQEKDLCNLACMNRRFLDLTTEDSLWEKFVMKRWKGDVVVKSHWKAAYKNVIFSERRPVGCCTNYCRHALKVAIVGPPSSGKSTVIAALETNSFVSRIRPVLSPRIFKIVANGHFFSLQLIDTNGSASREQRAKSYSLVDVFLLCLSIDQPLDEKTSKDWLEELTTCAALDEEKNKRPILVLGTKRDLREQPEPLASLTYQDGWRYVEQLRGHKYQECSCKQYPRLLHYVFQDVAAASLPASSSSTSSSSSSSSTTSSFSFFY
ncbi:Ras-related C3 botulinum toxin substrate 2 [Balamuthia mandrillaris]